MARQELLYKKEELQVRQVEYAEHVRHDGAQVRQDCVLLSRYVPDEQKEEHKLPFK